MRVFLSKWSSSTLAWIALFLAALCWGLVPVSTRYLLSSFTPLQLVLVRFLIAAFFLLFFLAPLRGQRWTLKELARVLFCGIVYVIGDCVSYAYGLNVVPAGIAGLLAATAPLLIVLIAVVFFHEKVSRWVWAGLALAVLGVILLFTQGSFGVSWNIPFLLGSLFIFISTLMWSIYTVFMTTISKKLGARAATALTVIVGTIPLLLFWDDHLIPIVVHLNAPAWIALLLLTFGNTVAATILWNYGVVHTTSSQASLFLYLPPLIGVAGAALLLHEQITIITLISGLFIMGGVALAQLFRPQPE